MLLQKYSGLVIAHASTEPCTFPNVILSMAFWDELALVVSRLCFVYMSSIVIKDEASFIKADMLHQNISAYESLTNINFMNISAKKKKKTQHNNHRFSDSAPKVGKPSVQDFISLVLCFLEESGLSGKQILLLWVHKLVAGGFLFVWIGGFTEDFSLQAFVARAGVFLFNSAFSPLKSPFDAWFFFFIAGNFTWFLIGVPRDMSISWSLKRKIIIYC